MENKTANRHGNALGARRLETCGCFVAMLLAVVLEAGCVYWLRGSGILRVPAGVTSSVVGQWTAASLPQGWLLGALLVLLYRIGAMLIPPKAWGQIEQVHNCHAFFRLWRWAVAVGGMQLGTLYLDRLTKVVQ
jgi:hypothetical protein